MAPPFHLTCELRGLAVLDARQTGTTGLTFAEMGYFLD
jgi:hypothetical protein